MRYQHIDVLVACKTDVHTDVHNDTSHDTYPHTHMHTETYTLERNIKILHESK